jgi:signal peptidase I
MQVMQWITAAILAAFVGYIAAWYTGSIEGNFALLLFLATVVTGVYWLAERFYFWPRRAAAAALEQAAVERRAELDRMGIAKTTSKSPTTPKAASSCSPGGWTGPPVCSR